MDGSLSDILFYFSGKGPNWLNVDRPVDVEKVLRIDRDDQPLDRERIVWMVFVGGRLRACKAQAAGNPSTVSYCCPSARWRKLAIDQARTWLIEDFGKFASGLRDAGLLPRMTGGTAAYGYCVRDS